MPKTKLAEHIANTPQFPPIDWCSALIMERMKTLGYNFKTLAAKTHIGYQTLRTENMKPFYEWREDIRTPVCRALGLDLSIDTASYPTKTITVKIKPKDSDYWFEVRT